jgi:nucleotide-binding universal stress UspA family protein
MLAIDTLLLPVDFSERSLEAARQAKPVARHFHSRVMVLNVLDADRRTTLEFEPGGWSADGLQGYLDREFADLSIQYLEKEGAPAEVIAEQARSGAADLMVIASHGRRPFEDFALGSVTAELLACSPCPVWVSLHMEKGPAPLFRRILCAVDLAEFNPAALDWAIAFADAFRAACNVIYVSAGGDGDLAHGAVSLTGTELEAVDQIKGKLGTRGQVILVTGELSKAAGGFSIESRADLLVIGRSRAGNEIAHVHSAAYSLVHDAPCPVVCV